MCTIMMPNPATLDYCADGLVCIFCVVALFAAYKLLKYQRAAAADLKAIRERVARRNP